MEKIKNSTEQEIDLTLLLKVLMKRKKLLFFGILFVTIISIAVSFLIKKTYESNGFLILSQKEPTSIQTETPYSQKEITLTKEETLDFLEKSGLILVHQYKAYFQYFSKLENFILFLENNEEFKRRDDKNIIEKRIRNLNQDEFNSLFSPVYAYSKKDLEVLAEINKDVINYVVGIRIRFEDNIPERAKYLVDNFGIYIRNCIINEDLINHIYSGLNNAKTSFNEYEIEIIKNKFKVKQLSLKQKDIEAIIKKYPDSQKIETRQVVSVEKGANIYLSPVTQLVGIESLIAELNRLLEEENREMEIDQIRIDYFTKAKAYLDETTVKNQKQILTPLKALIDTVFSDKDMNKDTVRQVYNELTNIFEDYHNKYYEKLRFSSEPEIPEKPIKPKKWMIVTISFLMSIFIFTILAFIFEWWENNRKIIIEKEKNQRITQKK